MNHTEIDQKIFFWNRLVGFNILLFLFPLVLNYKQLPTITGPIYISIFTLPCIIFGIVRIISLKRSKNQ